MKQSLLIAEDEEVTLALLRNVFGRSDLVVHEARTGEEALQHIDQHPVDVILTDLKMPGTDGLSVLAHARKVRPGAEVILMTGHATVESAVRAMKLGAFHYITKPFDVDEVSQLVDRALELASVRRENVNLRSLARGRGGLEHFIGVSDATKEVLALVRKVADTDSTVLITGESGTGKELIARALHYLSPRADRMLVPINCSAIPAELLESELFGHVKGAYTGAHATRAGKFEAAHHGTIFLDEIAEMSPPLQAKLLRVLQEKSVTPVGGNKAIQVDARVITATNRDLEEEISEGRFRSDLYFRLNVIPIRIPPLRDRRDDIPLLVEHFVGKYNREKKRTLEGVRPESLEILRRYTWPGKRTGAGEPRRADRRPQGIRLARAVGHPRKNPAGGTVPRERHPRAGRFGTRHQERHRGLRERPHPPGAASFGREQEPRGHPAGPEADDLRGDAETEEPRRR